MPRYDYVRYIRAHAAERRRAPRDDLLTRLVEADPDSVRLTDQEVGTFANVLLAAAPSPPCSCSATTVRTLDENPA